MRQTDSTTSQQARHHFNMLSSLKRLHCHVRFCRRLAVNISENLSFPKKNNYKLLFGMAASPFFRSFSYPLFLWGGLQGTKLWEDSNYLTVNRILQ